jgi:hypothetical protein
VKDLPSSIIVSTSRILMFRRLVRYNPPDKPWC